MHALREWNSRRKDSVNFWDNLLSRPTILCTNSASPVLLSTLIPNTEEGNSVPDALRVPWSRVKVKAKRHGHRMIDSTLLLRSGLTTGNDPHQAGCDDIKNPNSQPKLIAVVGSTVWCTKQRSHNCPNENTSQRVHSKVSYQQCFITSVLQNSLC
jgi:hypothetical protein